LLHGITNENWPCEDHLGNYSTAHFWNLSWMDKCRLSLNSWLWSGCILIPPLLSIRKGTFPNRLLPSVRRSWFFFDFHLWTMSKWAFGGLSWSMLNRYGCWWRRYWSLAFGRIQNWDAYSPRSRRGFSDSDLFQGSVEATFSIFIVFRNDEFFMTDPICTDCLRPILHPLIRCLLHFHRVFLFLCRQHRLMFLTKTLNHANKISILCVQLSDIGFIPLIAFHTYFMTSWYLMLVRFEISRDLFWGMLIEIPDGTFCSRASDRRRWR
jgi:hypothetical protein